MSFFSKFGSCYRSTAAVAPWGHQDGTAAEEVNEQTVARIAHWRPALAAISEDSNRARSPVQKSGKNKLEKKTSGRRGRSYSNHSRDSYWMSSMPPVVMPPFSWAPFMF